MTTITKSQRVLNIINKAVENGFEINENKTFEDIKIEAEDFLIENTTSEKEEADYSDNNLFYSDGKGFEINVTGELYSTRDLELMRKRNENFLILHTIIDSNANVIDLIKTFEDYEIEYKDFFDTPLSICIERDKNRDLQVTERVIRSFYNNYKDKYPLNGN